MMGATPQPLTVARGSLFRTIAPDTTTPRLAAEILKIEVVNHVDSDPNKPQRQLFGYGIAAKRYALYAQGVESISVAKASGHGSDISSAQRM